MKARGSALKEVRILFPENIELYSVVRLGVGAIDEWLDMLDDLHQQLERESIKLSLRCPSRAEFRAHCLIHQARTSESTEESCGELSDVTTGSERGLQTVLPEENQQMARRGYAKQIVLKTETVRDKRLLDSYQRERMCCK